MKRWILVGIVLASMAAWMVNEQGKKHQSETKEVAKATVSEPMDVEDVQASDVVNQSHFTLEGQNVLKENGMDPNRFHAVKVSVKK